MNILASQPPASKAPASFYLLHALLLPLFLLLASHSAHAQWQPTEGPNEESIADFAASGTTIYAACNRGVYGSDDEGVNWYNITNNLPTFLTTYRIIEVNGPTLFVGTNSGIWRSTNSGADWLEISAGLPANSRVDAILLGDTIIYTGTNKGIFSSTNNGDTWVNANNGFPSDIQGRAYLPMDTLLLLGTSKGLYASANNGASWTAHDVGLPDSSFVFSLARGGGMLYVSTADGVYRSVDSGANWTAATNNWASPFGIVLAVADSVLYAGTNECLYASPDSGTTWNPLQLGVSSIAFTSTTTTAIHFTSSGILTGGNSGAYFSDDLGSTWTQRNTGFPYVNVVTLATNGKQVFGGSDGGLYQVDSTGTKWPRILRYIANSVQARDSDLFIGSGSGLIYSSPDLGSAWTAGTGFFDNGQDVIAVTGNTVFAKYNAAGFSINNGWISTDKGATFTQSPLPYTIFTNVDDATLLAVDSQVIQYTSSGWIPVSGLFDGDTVLSLGASSSTIFAGTEGGILRSPMGGTAWSKRSFGSANALVTNVVVDGKNIYACTSDNRLFSSASNGIDWMEVTDNFTDSIVDRMSFGVMAQQFVITDDAIYLLGKTGIWTRPLEEVTGISNHISQAEFTAWPNPTAGTFTVASNTAGNLTVYNLLGHSVAQAAVRQQGSTRVDLGGKPAGIYIVALRSKDAVHTRRIVVR